jgi:hypothetical protein
MWKWKIGICCPHATLLNSTFMVPTSAEKCGEMRMFAIELNTVDTRMLTGGFSDEAGSVFGSGHYSVFEVDTARS